MKWTFLTAAEIMAKGKRLTGKMGLPLSIGL
jgi:hypothetical protein